MPLQPPPPHKSCKLGETTPQVMSYHYLTSNPSLQSVRFFLQTRFRCKVAPPSRHSLALRAHRHRLSAVARKQMYALARREMSRRARSLEFLGVLMIGEERDVESDIMSSG